MTKNILSILFILFIIFSSNAQLGFGKIEDINEIKEKTLLVELKAENKKTLKKLRNKPDKLKAYKDQIKFYNASIKEVFDNEWEYSKDIKYVPLQEIINITKDSSKKNNYAYFKNFTRISRNVSTTNSMPEYTFSIGLTDQKKPVYSMLYEPGYTNKADLTFIVQQFRNYFKSRIDLKTGSKSRKQLKQEFKNKISLLKSKTLYFDENFITSGLKKKIKSIYPYKYKITTKEDIDKAINDKNKDVVYIRPVPAAQTSQTTSKTSSYETKISTLVYIQYLISAGNGTIVTFVAPAGFSIGSGKKNNKTSVKSLKKIVKDIKK